MILRRIALAAVLALAAGGPAWAGQVTLKFHTFMAPQSAVWKEMHTAWMDKVEKDSGGRIRFERYPAMQLGGGAPNLYDQVRDGVADVIWTLPGYTPGRFPRSEVFELPFMMTDPEATSRAYWEFVQAHAKEEFRDVRLIALHVHGPGAIHTRSRAVRSIGDLEGLKMRAPSRLTTRLLAALGATPVGMPVPQIPDALSKGVIDGALLPWDVVPSIKVDELARYHAEFDPALPALYTATFVMAMNRAKYDALPPDLKKVIDANSGLETSAWLGRTQAAADAPGRASAEARGKTVTRLGEADHQAFRKAAERVDDEWIAEMKRRGVDGARLLEEARALVRRHSGK
jgi:TRAP-type C4-dicarboxylate transport system substrate-binding protein